MCTRRAKSTRRPCRREAAEWPRYDDLPAPVVACASHLTPAEWAACQESRARASAASAARRAAEAAAREERGEQAQPAPAVADYVPRPCTGQCISQARAWGREADSASSLCATCDGYVCISCGEAEVGDILECCDRCTTEEALLHHEPDALPDEVDAGPDPRMRLTAMANELVAATGRTHGYVNARINRTIGVTTRVGADEQVIRRAARAARDWLDQLLPSPQPDTAPPDVPDPGGRTVPAEHVEPSARVEGAARAGGRVLRSAPMDTPAPRPADDAVGEHAELTVTVRLTGQSARRLHRAAEIQQRPIEEVAAESISDEMRRDVHGTLYSGSDTYAATLDGLAKRLALIVRELGALPSGAAAHVIARAAAEKLGPLPEEWHQRMLEQLTEMWTGRTTEFGTRPDDSFGPLEKTQVQAMVTPAQWDALARIGAPGSIAQGVQEALEAGITALDR
ncbi:hypothetical protein ACH4KL_32390 [Streptomyces albus]|nr:MULTISPECIES: hypothetical protein [Streptomyces]GHJ19118.1 hypothetical protein TPA0909_07320 [Streptomyces albus]